MSQKIGIKGECVNFPYKAYPLKNSTRWVIKVKINGHWLEVVQIENTSLISNGFGNEKQIIETLITQIITNIQELLSPPNHEKTKEASETTEEGSRGSKLLV